MCKGGSCPGVSSCIYGMAFLGAAVYYIQQATTFGEGALGLLKAIIWPALLIYRTLGFLGM
ncbi:hypothetical protein A2524_00170 [Candidatus Wolfebacteria bacterium RIFOXYD12_FULL_48_21]|uniref:Uncharacterized protein n=1 Tax=Candidatus Wolfebacteria bacterium RIFOXYD1_FULL_48_65 TaxID=1802561 RepID=A0A1F8E3V2_9BACT|nr:MAG: hypothetical protein A2524_00170 [Candidatus Wolfebacteria bacterium RIFOXYD12_FULL_48_21]OGM95462.1 MAG: hypothetical protein A2610_01055 [Candidatus Wolfebacteria bacterium RIFOXYD1_FULL_48_65]